MNSSNRGQAALLKALVFLNAAVANTRLYSPSHPQVRHGLDQANRLLRRTLQAKPEITLLMVDDDLVLDGERLSAPAPQLRQFVRLLGRRGVERISFKRHLSIPELNRLVSDLAAGDSAVLRSSPGISFGKVQVAPAPVAPPLSPEMQSRIEALGSARDRSIERLHDLYDGIRHLKLPSVKGFEEIVHAFVEGMIGNVHPLHVLASLKSSDEYTFTHAVNVCMLTMAQAEALGIGGRQLYDIGIAASLHDAGKVFVPDEVLNKPGKLTEQEWQLMRGHTIRGARHILRVEGVPKVAFIGALEHHIRYDGSGYPALGEWRPSLVSQMIAIADMFDAMRSRRPYQAPKPDSLILDILRKERGTSYHPLLVDNFLGTLERRDADA